MGVIAISDAEWATVEQITHCHGRGSTYLEAGMRCYVASALGWPQRRLTNQVSPRLPVRQWVLSVPKRLRYFMRRDGAALKMVLRIFLRAIAQSLQTHITGAAQVDKATLLIGAVALAKPQVHIHRFGSDIT